MKVRIACVTVLAVLAGCTTPSAIFVTSDGRVMRCSASGWGLAGTAVATNIQEGCVNDMKTVGALRIGEAGSVGLTMASDPSVLRILKVVEGSPAARAGLKAGDLVTAVDGVTVKNSADMRSLMFGRVNTPVRITFVSNEIEKTVTLIRASIASVMPSAGK